jgi:hypothetical protein
MTVGLVPTETDEPIPAWVNELRAKVGDGNEGVRRRIVGVRADCLAATAEVPPIPAVTARGSQLTLRADVVAKVF